MKMQSRGDFFWSNLLSSIHVMMCFWESILSRKACFLVLLSLELSSYFNLTWPVKFILLFCRYLLPGKQVNSHAIVGPPCELSSNFDWTKVENIQVGWYDCIFLPTLFFIDFLKGHFIYYYFRNKFSGTSTFIAGC